MAGLGPLYPQSVDGLSKDLFSFKIEGKVYIDFLAQTNFQPFMGETSHDIVRMIETYGSDSAQIRIPKLSTPSVDNFIIGAAEQIRGRGSQIKADADLVPTDMARYPITEAMLKWKKFTTPVPVREHCVSMLKALNSKRLSNNFVNAMTRGAYPNMFTANANVDGNVPSYDRFIMPGGGAQFSSQQVTRAEYLAAAPLSTLIAARFQSSDTVTPVANTGAGTGMSTVLIERAKALARLGSQNDIVQNAAVSSLYYENIVEPAHIGIKNGQMQSEYIMLLHPSAVQMLSRDPLWQSNATARGAIVSPDQPNSIIGADYLGTWQGVHLYSCQELVKYGTYNTGNYNVGVSLLLGAGALAYCKVGTYDVVEDYDKLEDTVTYLSTVIDGVKMLKFPGNYANMPGAVAGSSTKVEHGVIHVLSAF